MSPTQRSLEYLRNEGYLVAIVEHWQPFARIRQDLFGFIDLLAIRRDETLAVQVTASGVSSRIKKIEASPHLGRVREAGWKIHVHGWRKSAKTNKYVMRIEDLS